MPSILVIDKTGTVKTVSVKKIVEIELYKKAGLKVPDGFKCYTTWSIDYEKKQYEVSLYGKTIGKANHENKYDFPPPVDNTLFFGSCVIIAKIKNGIYVDLTEESWKKIYETLFGGFEELGDEDSESECDTEDDMDGPVPRTKNGYVKDGFVVDDEESEEDDEDEDIDIDDDDNDNENIFVKPKVKKPVAKKSGSKKIKAAFELPPIEQEELYLDCTSELSEESYID
jgi:hypothetical protein